MRRIGLIVVAAQVALVVGFAVGAWSGRIPLGVPGEWEWQRVRAAPSAPAILMGLAALGGYSAYCAAGWRTMAATAGRPRVWAWLLGLVLASVAAQGIVQEAAPEGYGLSKWILALHAPGSSGYYTVAKAQMGEPRRFLADYPAWIARQDALHVGTHPPGLFMTAKGLLEAMEGSPSASRWACELAPGSASAAIRTFRESLDLPRADAASLALTGALTLLACASTVVPLYALARATSSAPASWASAALWPLVPSALMFQPTADTAFPMLSTTALALAAWSGRVGPRRGTALCVASGLVMALGMAFTLAFLPVGLVVALVILVDPEPGLKRKLERIAATGIGFLALTFASWAATTANPFAIWWSNQRNHARFYVEYPRNYAAWMIENPLELAVGLGLPAATWALIGLGSGRQSPRVAWATVLVLVVLTASGKNLSEVGRLWLPLMPPLLVAAGSGFERLGGEGKWLGGTIILVGLQALILQSTIQVVYPV